MLGAVADILRRRRTQGWLVGGSVRDRELGRYSPDLDVVVTDDAAAVAEEVAAVLDAPWFVLSERHAAYRVVGLDGHVDVAAVRGSGILDDLAERDFTVNAMAVPIGPGGEEGRDLVDPYGGLTHLRQGRLVAVSERIFRDDPLRLMRAARFAHTLGLRPEPSLLRSIQAEAPELARSAAERVAAEMVLTLAGGRAADAVGSWDELGLLAVVLPEVGRADGLAPTLALLKQLDDLLERPAAWFPATATTLAGRLARPVDGGVPRPVALRLAGLAHRMTAGEAEAAGRSLKLSGEMISLLRTVARHFSQEAGLPARPKGREAVLFLWGVAPWEAEVILLEAAAGADAPGQALALWVERTTGGVPPCPVDGESLMRELHLDSGPLLGKVLREARLAWEAGEATSLAEVLAVARGALGAG